MPRKSLLKKFFKNRSGSAAVEFALVTPVLTAVVMGCIEFGLIVFSFNSVQNATRDTIRQVATNRITILQASAKVNADVPAWLSNKITVDVSQTNISDFAANQITLVSKFSAKAAAPTSFLGWAYESLILTTRVTMQQEPTL